ncbi:acyl-CoA thioesterase/BAAT N-terminal domain-containing protein [Leucobacter allii]|uniref:acyl-CoA thioesterase/bile acid-CoA:amino acid N-acyltransferase family protein n=1 Tax=Leucobacter allii TaxID=2932247 RepID=UPI001FCFBBD7|nr:acyl-CoA thioesterase/bile acid-CoA:amino acid N-acyltransferase family protein [Leucobacter allii]UOR01439.1 acyl-CoA thioesterase/BAAT N-terminal domain-containing protein [Leucobacter allii]
MTAALRLRASPELGTVEDPVEIEVTGAVPGGAVRVDARLRLSGGRRLSAWGVFGADERGRVDLGEATPIDGSYAVADASGLIWSLRPDADWPAQEGSELRAANPFLIDELDDYAVELTARAEVPGGRTETASARLRRRVLAPGVRRIALPDAPFSGVLFLPPAEHAAPYRTLVQFGGSGGGIQERRAAQYAAHGFAVLALGYFLVPGDDRVPAELTEIPLEYFAGAMAWLRERPELDAARVGLVGTSRGGELALLLGATYPEEIAAVVAWVPSGVVWGEHAQPGGDPRGERASWTRGGAPVPFVPPRSRVADFGVRDGRSVHASAFLANVARAAAAGELERATIPVERIGGPVLLIAGEDDALWPSAWFAERIETRLLAHGFPHRVRRLSFPRAGHSVSFELEPTTFVAKGEPVRDPDPASWPQGFTVEVTESFHLGGAPDGIAAANRRIGPELWAFLDEALPGRQAPRTSPIDPTQEQHP